MSDNFIEKLNKLIKIISLSIEIDETQKLEWIKLIESLKSYRNYNLNILTNELANININVYNNLFQNKINKLSKKQIIKYSFLALNYINNKNIDTALAFLVNFDENIHKINASYVKRIQKLKEKKGLLYARQRSLKFAKDNFSDSIEELSIKQKN